MDRITDISEVEQHLDNWDKGWAEQMERIWREKIRALRVVDTGALRNSIDHTISGGNDNKTIIHTFLEYGLYQDMGVGKGYKMSHQGAGVGLAFLDEDYRQQHNLGEPRKPRRWFSKKATQAPPLVFKKILCFSQGHGRSPDRDVGRRCSYPGIKCPDFFRRSQGHCFRIVSTFGGVFFYTAIFILF